MPVLLRLEAEAFGGFEAERREDLAKAIGFCFFALI